MSHAHHHDIPDGLPPEAVAECPLMGTRVVKAEAEAAGLVRDFNGKRYWFCCSNCTQQWDADPAAFAIS